MWSHIQELYDKVTSIAIASEGIYLLPKLKLEHIALSSYSCMRVNFAAQVSSCMYCAFLLL